MTDVNQNSQTVWKHFEELQRRFFWTLIVFIVLTLVAFYFAEFLYHVIMIPVLSILPAHSQLISTQPFEVWVVYAKTAMIFGFMGTLPILFWHVWRFMSPGLYKNEKLTTVFASLFSSLFFIFGVIFGYKIMLPSVFNMTVVSLTSANIQFLPHIDDTLSFVIRLLIGFGIVFEIPVIMALLSYFKLVTTKRFVKIRPYIILVIFVVAAILTPPDVVSQLLMAGPMLLLYELGLILTWIFGKKKA